MRRRFSSIKGLSEERRMPRLGKIRLGIKVKKKRTKKCKHSEQEDCMYCTYPKETPHFVVPPEVAKVYGDKPTELDILLPVNDREVIFPQSYEYYGSSRGLKCAGNGEEALRYNEETKALESVDCPCELLTEGKCSQRGHLMFILPKVNIGGVYQIDTTSINSIIDINSSLDYVTALIGRFALVPLKLKREPRETHHDGKKQIHYTMRIELEGDIQYLNTLRQDTRRILEGPQYILPAPEMTNPVYDGPSYPEEAEEEAVHEPEPAPEPETFPEPAPEPAPEPVSEPVAEPTAEDRHEPALHAQIRAIRNMLGKLGFQEDQMASWVRLNLKFQVERLEDLSRTQAVKVIEVLNRQVNGQLL